MKYRKRLTGVAVLAALSALWLVALRQGGSAGTPGSVPPEQRAGAGDDDEQVHAPAAQRRFIGVVIAGEVAEVAARESGLVHSVQVRLGDRVERGGTIATIDDHALRDELEAAQATLAAAQADHGRAALELEAARERRERWNTLADSGGAAVVSREELAELGYAEKYADQGLKSANAQVSENRVRVKQLQRRVSERVVQAPFTGTVAQRYVDPGATVQPGEPIVRLVREGTFWVRFAVPEDSGSSLRRGAHVDVQVDTLDLSLSGTVEKIAPEVDAASRMLFAEAKLTVPAELADISLAGRVARVALLPAR
jgi:RND family efflux transporter MFP subunit